MAIHLSVNLNKVALLRNARGANNPSPRVAAHTCLDAGAHGLTLHWRADNRHTRADDVRDLRAICLERGAEFNLEGDDRDELIALALQLRVTQFTLVPVRPGEITSDHGWDLPRQHDQLAPILARLNDAGIRTAIFMEADARPHGARPPGPAPAGSSSTPSPTPRRGAPPDRRTNSRASATPRGPRVAAGLEVNAGHDLDLRNTPRLARDVPEIVEVSIGHALARRRALPRPARGRAPLRPRLPRRGRRGAGDP